MNENTRTALKIKTHIGKFSGIISKGLSKAKRRLIKEVLYGIQATKDVKLSNISRSLREEIELIKTEDRLSRNLDDIDFTGRINEEICWLGSRKVLEEMVIAIDVGDVRKRYAKKMEYLCGIHDGSENEVGNGYWLCKVIAADIDHKQVIPMYCEAWSQEAEGFKSEPDQLFKTIDTVSRHIGTKGIWAIDRGGDSRKVFDKFLDGEQARRFVIRLQKTRNLVRNGVSQNSYEMARMMDTPHQTRFVKFEKGKEVAWTISYQAVPVKLPHREEKLFLVVAKGFGEEPMMLLTNCMVNLKVKESIWRIVEIYLTRWKCEESFRYIKQSYNLEDIRVRSYTAIRNMVVLVLAVSYFAAVYLGQSIKLKFQVERILLISRRFFGVPTFFNYAIADGIYTLLFPDKTGLNLRRKEDDFQLCLDFR